MLQKNCPEPGKWGPLRVVIYAALVILVGGWILLIFVRPTPAVRHGINDFKYYMFLDTVEGKGFRPFAYRALLPTTVRSISAITPADLSDAFSRFVASHGALSAIFGRFGWETDAAYRYVLALAIMLASLVAFGYYAARLILLTCGIPDTFKARLSVSCLALLGLPPFFKYCSYLYDPPQLFLFTSALYYLARQNVRAFATAFCFCCLNKETAVLLIPLFAVTQRTRLSSRYYWSALAALSGYFVLVKGLLTYHFRDNPGRFVVFPIQHNIVWLTRGWTFDDLITVVVPTALIFLGWRNKPPFLKTAFLCTAPPLVFLALFMGYMDEWRDYYEVYPTALGLVLYSLLELRARFSPCQG